MPNDHWNTGENVLESVRAFFGGPPTLDPCHNETSLVGAINTFNEQQDGLAQPWKFKNAFVNPPYSHGNLAKWSQKCFYENNDFHCEICLLIPVSTSTKWWANWVVPTVYRNGAILFYNKRIRFVGAGGSPRFDSCLVYYGNRTEDFKAVFSPQGWVVSS